MKPVRSMTGYAAVRRQTAAGELTVSLRSVNHRGLDLHFYNSPEFGAFENALRAALKKGLTRGHVEVRVNLLRSAESDKQGLNRDSLRQFVTAFRLAAEEFGLHGEPDLNRWLTLPGSLAEKVNGQPLPASLEADAVSTLETCIAELNETREREGEALRAEIASRIAEIATDTARIRHARTEALYQFNARLRERLTDLLAGAQIPESRLIEEAALLADRSDIQEELTRLAVHTSELERMLAAGGEIGKKIDFLLQEMNRETNTALAKSSNAGEPGLRITNAGLAIKANIEKIREQGLNLE